MISILFQVSILQAAETRLALRSWQLEQQDKAAAPTLSVQGCGHSDRADAIEHHEIRSARATTFTARFGLTAGWETHSYW